MRLSRTTPRRSSAQHHPTTSGNGLRRRLASVVGVGGVAREKRTGALNREAWHQRTLRKAPEIGGSVRVFILVHSQSGMIAYSKVQKTGLGL